MLPLAMARKPYPSDLDDEQWAFVAPYLTLMREDAPQRVYALRDVFDAVLWVVRTGSPWRYLPGDLPPWEVVYQQAQRWLRAGVFEAITHPRNATCGSWCGWLWTRRPPPRR